MVPSLSRGHDVHSPPEPSSDPTIHSLDDYATVTSSVDQSANAAENPADLAELERRVSKLSTSLDAACEDTSLKLERTIDEISRTIPRLTYDLQFMRESAFSLQNALHIIQSRSGLISSEETAAALERLHVLDTTRRNMDASLAVLREAESWTSLESEVVSFLADQSYARAANRLSEASKSLAVFQNTPEFESRKTLMVNLQNQLEASLSSALVAAINSRDVEACRTYFDIFCNIQRESEFRSYWNGSKRKSLTEQWESTVIIDCDESASAASQTVERAKLSAFLSDFYRDLLELLQLERVSIMSIFPDPQATLSTFIMSTMASLQPSISQRLSSLTSHYSSAALRELILVFKATEEFAVATDRIMEKVGFAGRILPASSATENGDGDAPPLQRTHSRRKSHRMSMSRKFVPRNSAAGGLEGVTLSDNSWDEALFEPFVDYQTEYPSLEKKALHGQLQKLWASNGASADVARLLRERSVDMFTLAEESLDRCMAFTHGYGSAALVKVLDDIFEEFLESSRQEMITQHKSLPIAPSGAQGSIAPGGEDFAELDYSPEDYAAFQLALHLLEAARALLDRLAVFETKLRGGFLQVSNALRMMRNDPLGLYFSGTTRGAIGLLQASPLNSSELHDLLEAIDPEQPHVNAQQLSSFSHRQSSPNTKPILLGARGSVIRFTTACQNFLQETILSPLVKQFATYASSPAWSAPGNPKEKRGGGGGATGGVSEVVIPTFSLSPSQTIQRVAEGLLNLPRLFEVYADDDALAFSIETLPFFDARELRTTEENEFIAHPGSAEDQKVHKDQQPTERHSRRLSHAPLAMAMSPPPKFVPIALTPEAVSSAWLASLTLSLLSHLTTQILPSIKTLSDAGAAQLAEDLGYLIQIVKALNVEWEALEQWKEAVELDEAEGRSRLKEKTQEGQDAVVLSTVAKLRGWNT
ncbi:hypothetical protein BD410DRAFT_823114 [Rickenella mellea]|uniref:Conserved oligomeric Golgi complex subunit 7 n=1 Tax=Rickenella mellea TaxID=50990 RepID=A0A4Y7PI76_9AGAM|nr:hypothetical protein BD410DRAFT_823114 [Rickenella mellea]